MQTTMNLSATVNAETRAKARADKLSDRAAALIGAAAVGNGLVNLDYRGWLGLHFVSANSGREFINFIGNCGACRVVPVYRCDCGFTSINTRLSPRHPEYRAQTPWFYKLARIGRRVVARHDLKPADYAPIIRYARGSEWAWAVHRAVIVLRAKVAGDWKLHPVDGA